MPEWRAEIRRRLEPLRLPPAREEEIVEEVAQHLEDCYRELCASGRADEEAAACAWRELDEAGVLAHEVGRSERPAPIELPAPGAPQRGPWLGAIWQDARFAARTLRRSPGFSLTVIFALALSIGPLSAIVSIGNWLLWRPHPGVAEPSRLAIVWFGTWGDNGGMSPSGVSYANQSEITSRARTISGMAGVQESSSSLAIAGRLPRMAGTATVTANFFDVLGVPMRAGRPFSPDDDRPPFGSPVVVIGEPLARAAFGSPAQALGKRVTLNSSDFTVIGVAPTAFAGISATGSIEVWMTGSTWPYLHHANEERPVSRTDGIFYEFVVRAARGEPFTAVQAELTVLARGLAEAYPTDNEKFHAVQPRIFPGLGIAPLARPRTARMVDTLLAIAGTLLLLGCANVANLLIFRTTRRSHEVSVRKALGASWSRLIQLQMMESCWLALCGATAGLGLAVLLKQVIQQLLFPRPAGLAFDVPIDARVLGLTVLAALGTGILASVAPAWMAARRSASGVGHYGSRTSTGAPRLRGTLAALQLGLSLTLLIGALLLVSTLRNLRSVELGFDASHLTLVGVELRSHGYTPERALAYQREVLTALEGIGDFRGVSLSAQGPFRSSTRIRLIPPGGDAKQPLLVGANGITHAYFDVLSLPLARGRQFTSEESFAPGNVSPVILNEALALRLFGTIDVVGRTIKIARTIASPERDLPIVGVARDARWNTLTEAAAPFLYQPLAAFDFGPTRAEFIVRSALPSPRVGEIAAAVAAQTTSAVPLAPPRPLSMDIDRVLDEERTFAWMLSLLAPLGFILASLGLYGLVAQTATERRREFGIRLAVGATGADIVGLLARYAAIVSATGMAVGLMLSYYAARMVDGMLFGVTPLDPGVYAWAAATLVAVVALACVVPAMRALRVQPVEVLRTE
jgi:predicted permease